MRDAITIPLAVIIICFWAIGMGFIQIGLSGSTTNYPALITGISFIGVAVMLHLLWYVVEANRKLFALSKGVALFIKRQESKAEGEAQIREDRETSQNALVKEGIKIMREAKDEDKQRVASHPPTQEEWKRELRENGWQEESNGSFVKGRQTEG